MPALVCTSCRHPVVLQLARFWMSCSIWMAAQVQPDYESCYTAGELMCCDGCNLQLSVQLPDASHVVTVLLHVAETL